MNKKSVIVVGSVLAILLLVVGGIFIFKDRNDSSKEDSDAVKFASEYTKVDDSNIFVYRDIDEIIRILENGTGIVYLGFPECKWCQQYVPYLNEVATELAIDKIYYYNIYEDRKNNTPEYLKIVSILEDYLQYDEEGNKRIYVPSVITLNKGEIVGFDDETAWDTKGFDEPSEYWTDEEVADLKEKLEIMISDTEMNICTECD